MLFDEKVGTLNTEQKQILSIILQSGKQLLDQVKKILGSEID
jgi:hypothetical protein